MENQNNRKIGHVVKILRTASGLRQKDLAERVGIKPHYLSLVESGKREPSLNVVRLIAKALNVPVSYLFWELDDTPKEFEGKERNLWNELKTLLLEMEKSRLADGSMRNE